MDSHSPSKFYTEVHSCFPNVGYDLKKFFKRQSFMSEPMHLANYILINIFWKKVK